MNRKATMAMTLGLLLALAPALSAAPRYFVRPAYGFGYWHSAHWYPGYWYPGPRVIVAAPVTGELRLRTDDQDARVYVDGGYLGIARKLKKFDLRPGDHEIELRDARGRELFEERVAIVPGRTTEFDAMGIAR
jgi:PEGA domain